MTFNKCTMFSLKRFETVSISFLTILLLECSLISCEELYRQFYFDDICPGNDIKREILLKTGGAIFRLDEANLKTRKMLQEKEISCHIELETEKGYGFHVYIDEMNLDTGDLPLSFISPKPDHYYASTKCHDYLQFGRDVMMFTTHSSQPFCGTRTKIQYGRNISESEHNNQIAMSSRQGIRFYVEEKDVEMDLWLKIRRSSGSKTRSLTLIVTTFKKTCSDDDVTHRICPRSEHCIRQEMFCDGLVNCAWPSGDTATDELNCDSYSWSALDQYSSSTDSNLFRASDIPIIIIGIVAVLAFVATVGFAFRRIMEKYFNVPSTSYIVDPSTGGRSRRSDFLTDHISETTPALTNETLNRNEPLEVPSAPPTYEEAIKIGNTDLPPPYEPSAPPLPNSSQT